MIATLEFHEVCSVFPLMAGQEYTALLNDIRDHGLREPVWTWQGRIIDGRNRYRACLELEIVPACREWNGQGSLLAFVVSLNLHRRHLNESQRAMIAATLAKMDRGRPETNTATAVIKQGEAASLLNVSLDSIQRAKHVLEEGVPELQAKVQEGFVAVSAAADLTELSQAEQAEVVAQGVDAIQEAVREIRAEKAALSNPDLYTSKSAEWYTPAHIIEMVRQVLGDIDLDPCSCHDANETVRAKRFFSKKDDGLSFPWTTDAGQPSRLYLNPPYGREVGDWVNKLADEYEGGCIGEAIALLPARTDTNWIRRLRRFPRCFVAGRLNFSEATNGATFPSVVIYLGADVDRFAAVFDGIGDIYLLRENG